MDDGAQVDVAARRRDRPLGARGRADRATGTRTSGSRAGAQASARGPGGAGGTARAGVGAGGRGRGAGHRRTGGGLPVHRVGAGDPDPRSGRCAAAGRSRMGDRGRCPQGRHRRQAGAPGQVVAPDVPVERPARRDRGARDRGDGRPGRVLRPVGARRHRGTRGATAAPGPHPRRRLGQRAGDRADDPAGAAVHGPDRAAHRPADGRGPACAGPAVRPSGRAGARAARPGRARSRRGADGFAGRNPAGLRPPHP